MPDLSPLLAWIAQLGPIGYLLAFVLPLVLQYLGVKFPFVPSPAPGPTPDPVPDPAKPKTPLLDTVLNLLKLLALKKQAQVAAPVKVEALAEAQPDGEEEALDLLRKMLAK